jgi:hypothetical protein
VSATVKTLARRHLVRYDDHQTATICGLHIAYHGKWAHMSVCDVAKPDVVLKCPECDRLWNPDECAAEMVYEGICV